MSQGELWRQEFRIGKETTYGTAVTPTRRLYLEEGSGLDPGGSAEPISVLTGGRGQVVTGIPGVSEPAGSFTTRIESGEILELLEMALTGSPVVTTPATATDARLHTYTGPGTLASGTVQYFDGARGVQQAGVYVNAARIAGAANGTNILSGDFFGSAQTFAALSGTVTARSPVPYSGWETSLAIDPVTGTDNYGATVIAAGDSVVNWDLPVSENNVGRLYTAANTRAMQAATQGVFNATGRMSFKAIGTRSLTEYNNFVAGAMVRVRYTFGDNRILEAALTSKVTWDAQIIWTRFTPLGTEANVRTYEAEFSYVMDEVNNFGVRMTAQNMRLASF